MRRRKSIGKQKDGIITNWDKIYARRKAQKALDDVQAKNAIKTIKVWLDKKTYLMIEPEKVQDVLRSYRLESPTSAIGIGKGKIKLL